MVECGSVVVGDRGIMVFDCIWFNAEKRSIVLFPVSSSKGKLLFKTTHYLYFVGKVLPIGNQSRKVNEYDCKFFGEGCGTAKE